MTVLRAKMNFIDTAQSSVNSVQTKPSTGSGQTGFKFYLAGINREARVPGLLAWAKRHRHFARDGAACDPLAPARALPRRWA